MLPSLGVSPYMVSWTPSILTGRSFRLLFNGSPNLFSLITIGTPQGYPVSLLLFVI